MYGLSIVSIDSFCEEFHSQRKSGLEIEQYAKYDERFVRFTQAAAVSLELGWFDPPIRRALLDHLPVAVEALAIALVGQVAGYMALDRLWRDAQRQEAVVCTDTVCLQ